MPTPLSIDLRQRIVTAVDGGASIRMVAARYCGCGRISLSEAVNPKNSCAFLTPVA